MLNSSLETCYKDKGTSSSFSDFNDITQIGSYWIEPNITTANHPRSGAYGWLEVVLCAGGIVLQRFTRYVENDIYERQYVNNKWSSWRLMPTSIVDGSQLEYLSDALQISTNYNQSTLHEPKKIDGNTSQKPPNMSDGIRFCFPIVSIGFIVVIVIGFKYDSTSAIWKISYNKNTGWSEWVEL